MIRLSAADMLAIALSGRDATLGERLRHCSDIGELNAMLAAWKAKGVQMTDEAMRAEMDMRRVLK